MNTPNIVSHFLHNMDFFKRSLPSAPIRPLAPPLPTPLNRITQSF